MDWTDFSIGFLFGVLIVSTIKLFRKASIFKTRLDGIESEFHQFEWQTKDRLQRLEARGDDGR